MLHLLASKTNMQQKTTSVIRRLAAFRPNHRWLLAGLAMIIVAGTIVPTIARADQFDEQINALQNQNNQNRAIANQLQSQANSYQDAVDKLQGQINGVQASINENRAKQADLQNKITEAEAELAKQKAVLGESIRQQYIDGQVSTLEMLASSKDLNQFVDKQQYRTSVQNKIKTTLDKITALRHQLAAQKDEVDKLLKDQEAMQATLAAQRQTQNELLAYTAGQRDAYNSAIRNNNAQIAALRQAQIAANSRFIGGGGSGPACGGGYPAMWCEIPQDSVIDYWGMYNRECVSYTAFKVAASGRYMPYWGGIGNANQWDDNARRAGIPVDTNPRPGDVAISNAGFYGHAMYVEAVNPNGTIFISQYNASLNGTYSTNTISPAGLVFIHFP